MKNLLDPAILFFVFGVLAGALRSNLRIPEAIAKFLSLYLLMALGLKGRLRAGRVRFRGGRDAQPGRRADDGIRRPRAGLCVSEEVEQPAMTRLRSRPPTVPPAR
jgi:hypothetical protein